MMMMTTTTRILVVVVVVRNHHHHHLPSHLPRQDTKKRVLGMQLLVLEMYNMSRKKKGNKTTTTRMQMPWKRMMMMMMMTTHHVTVVVVVVDDDKVVFKIVKKKAWNCTNFWVFMMIPMRMIRKMTTTTTTTRKKKIVYCWVDLDVVPRMPWLYRRRHRRRHNIVQVCVMEDVSIQQPGWIVVGVFPQRLEHQKKEEVVVVVMKTIHTFTEFGVKNVQRNWSRPGTII
mmetsp:Transcript_2216/g.4042  ORF Transcript_2216/g.4042 Transcript_2216/m.4042 type:complete len:228 (-) Transcript_2216:3189-3872(-)